MSLPPDAPIREHIGYDDYRPQRQHWDVERVLIAILLGIFAVAMILAQPAKSAERMCAPADAVRKKLAEAGEQPILRGLATTGVLFEVWSTETGTTWTATATTTNGQLCILSKGHSAEPATPKAEPGKPT